MSLWTNFRSSVFIVYIMNGYYAAIEAVVRNIYIITILNTF